MYNIDEGWLDIEQGWGIDPDNLEQDWGLNFSNGFTGG